MILLYILCGVFVICALIFAAWALLILPDKGNPLIPALVRHGLYAHRGLHDKPRIPENSLAAFARAKENGFGSELDVHLSKDGRLAVIHDESLERTCGKKGLVCELTSQELSVCRLEGTDEPVPFLEDVLTLYDGAYPLIIELKPYRGNHRALAAAAVKALASYSGEYCIESFDPRALYYTKKFAPDAVTGQLSARLRRNGQRIPLPIDFILKNLLSNLFVRPDFIAYHIGDRDNLSLRLMKQLYHPPLFYWTVTSTEQQKTAQDDGAVSIFEGFDPKK